MSQLGNYITHEYGVLLQIFSYLPSKSLANASKVCREWKEVAQRVLMKRNKPVGYFKSPSLEWKLFDDIFPEQIQPKVILHFQSSYGKKNLGSDFFPMLSQIYNMDNVSVYNIRNPFFISSNYYANKMEINPRLGKNAEGALILCDMPGVTVKSFFTPPGINKQVAEEFVRSVMELNDTKCIILISGGDECSIYMAHLLTAMFNKLRHGTLLMAGAIAHKPVRKSPFDESTPPGNASLCVSFHGRNVSPYVGVHELHEDIEMFLENMAKEVGPTPPGSIRLAFMFTCVNRHQMLKETEATMFSKYFPNVPIYGLWSYGELTAALTGECIDVSPISNTSWLRSECTSYLIITLKKTV